MPNEKILLVDDEDSNLRLLTQWLVPLGDDFELAANGKEAVRMAKKSRPDLIIMDIMMPVMDGYEACRILKTDEGTQNIPIIMVTALHDRDSNKKRARLSPRVTEGACRNILIRLFLEFLKKSTPHLKRYSISTNRDANAS